MNDNYIMKVLDFKQEYMITKEEKVQIEEARDVAKVVNSIEGLGNSTRERFIMLGLDNKSYVTFIYNVHIGTLNASLIHPRDCFKAAIENNSASVIFVHNHPSQWIISIVKWKKYYDSNPFTLTTYLQSRHN